jgi:hypothetical protein
MDIKTYEGTDWIKLPQDIMTNGNAVIHFWFHKM